MKKVGIYNPYLDTKGGGERVCLTLAETLAKNPDLRVSMITHKKEDLKIYEKYFAIDLNRVDNFVVTFDTKTVQFLMRIPMMPGRIRNLISDLRVRKCIRQAGFDVFVNNCHQSNLPNPCKYGVYMCMFPQKLSYERGELGTLKSIYVSMASRLSRLMLHPAHKYPIDTYQLITANSAYTQSYITRLWKRDSDILYPYGEDMLQSGATKQKQILSVGRFFENVGENHNKRHDLMVEAFKGLPELHKQGWELHLAGSVAEDVGTLRYVIDLLKAAEGYPIFFHFNCPYPQLKKLFNQATIYWHATGFGSDPEKHPEKQEHFGIVTVESLSAKCVPIVINSAGQKEVITEGENGFLWDSIKELHEKTTMVAHMKPAERTKLQKTARSSFHRYDKVAFEKLVIQIFGELYQ